MRNVGIYLLMASILFLTGCHEARELRIVDTSEPTTQVRVVEVHPQDLLRAQEVIGTVEPKVRATLEAKITGRIAEMPVRLGQTVGKGDLLVRLDAAEAQAKLAQAKATREQAETDLRRFTALLREQALTQAEFDAAQARFRVAEAAVHEAETMFGYAEVIAPFDGVVGRKFAEAGDLAVPGKPLLEIEQSEPLRFVAKVPESLISQVRTGKEFAIRIEGQEGEIQGQVVDISPSSDPATRSFRVELDLKAAGLRSGSFGRLFIPNRSHPTLAVPVAALVRRGQLQILFVVKDGRAELRLVTTGATLDDKVEILSGLTPGEKVVTENAAVLRDGQPVSSE